MNMIQYRQRLITFYIQEYNEIVEKVQTSAIIVFMIVFTGHGNYLK